MIKFYKLRKMVLEVIALINDMNKLINDRDVIRDFKISKQKFCPPPLLFVLTTRECLHL